jgi:ribosomal protein S12 methylthiotransferase
VRQLYLYPTAITDELVEVLSSSARVLPYVDVPLQHASDRVLKAMRRGATEARQRALVEMLRARIPNLTLRTTFIVGFPGETDDDFERLCEFVRELRFDRVGVFRYSDEDGTAGSAYPDKVPRAVARRRHRALIALQREIMSTKLASLVGSEHDVLVDHGGRSAGRGRLASQAPEIDGVVFLRAAKQGPGAGALIAGEMRSARITGVRGADLEAEVTAPAR